MKPQTPPRPPGPLDGFPVSPMQHYMLRETMRAPRGAGTNVEQVVLRLGQAMDMDRFTQAWLRVINHHEVLRLGFTIENQTVESQFIGKPEEINIEVNDWRKIGKPETEEYVRTFLQADRKLGFSLTTPPLFRMALLQTAEEEGVLVWSFHHAIADKASIVAILRDLFLVYQDAHTTLAPSRSFRRYMETFPADREKAKIFWNAYLKDYKAARALPFAPKKRPVTENRRQQHSMAMTTTHITGRISREKTHALRAFCRDHSFDIEYLLMGIWAVLLSHYSGTPRIGFGAQRSMRPIRKKHVIDTGMYVNTLPVAFHLDPDALVSELANNTRNTHIKTSEFLYCSFSDIGAWCGRQPDDPLYEVFFSYDPISIDSALEPFKSAIACKTVSLRERIPGALFLKIVGTDALYMELQYDRRRFDLSTVQQIMAHLMRFTDAVSPSPAPVPRLRDVGILSDEEKHRIFNRLNTLAPVARPDSCIHHLIEIQAATGRDAVAVSTGTDSQGFTEITYHRMNSAANQLAGYLADLGTGPETTVAVMPDHDPGFPPTQYVDPVTVIFGILKTGAAFIVLNPADPDLYLLNIIQDAAPGFLITTSRHRGRLADAGLPTVCLDLETDKIARMGRENPAAAAVADDLACISYVSGPGTRPTGVMMEHAALVAYTRSASEVFDIRPRDRVLLPAPLGTVNSLQALFPCLFSGACIVTSLPDRAQWTQSLVRACETHRITILFLTAFDWEQLSRERTALPLLPEIRLVIISGGRLPGDHVIKRGKILSPGARLIHLQGRAEAMGIAAWTELSHTPGPLQDTEIAFKPFHHTNLFIANHFSMPALPGTTGELYVGGQHIARGYANNPELTAKRFRQLPYLSSAARFFRTRDRAELNPETGIVFHSPADRQIIMGGDLVNPREIEQTVLEHPLVSGCALGVSGDILTQARTRLFFVKDVTASSPLTPGALEKWLSEKLPAHMIPDSFERSASLPRTPEGGVDYKALAWIHESPHSPGPGTGTRPKPKRRPPETKEGHRARKGRMPIILVGNSVGAAQGYAGTDLGDHSFFHAPIFIHFFTMEAHRRLELTIPELAARCLHDIRQTHPAGPYIIIGECQNATVAHESACQASMGGKEVALLVIIDENWVEPAIGNSRVKKKKSMSFLQRQFSELRELGAGHMLGKLTARVKTILFRCITALDPLRAALNTALNRPVPEAVQFRSMESVFYESCDATPFQPQTYGGKVLLLYSRNWIETYHPGLNRYYSGDVHTRHIDIAHDEWFKPAQVKLIVEEINRILAS